MLTPITGNKWLSCPQPGIPAPLRLWCFPFAGGGAAAWHPWAPRLSGVAQIVAFRLPGRESRLAEPPIASPVTLIAALAAEMAPYADETYAVYGHSLGGILAFETARELRARGLPEPRAVVISGVRAPHLPRTEPDLHHLPAEEFVYQIHHRYGGIPDEIRDDAEFIELMLPALRADLSVYETYQFRNGAPLNAPLLALGGFHDATVPREQILGWARHTASRFECEFFPGEHFFVQSHLGAVTQRVRMFLSQV
ncbi:MAG: thioesterase domain-containing protein [Opitutaceae bacterium]|nr:thioesterase domain-containing protein [Opitutaceae bacterium]